VQAKAIVATKPFKGVRIEVGTSLSFDEVLSRLRGLMGTTNVPQIVALAQGPISQEEYVRQVEEKFIGPSGFMLFNEIDHGGWLTKLGIKRRTGNPMEGLWVQKLNQQGQIYDLTVYLRPYPAVTVLRNMTKDLGEKRGVLVGRDYWELPMLVS
jgi:hypothetical protein